MEKIWKTKNGKEIKVKDMTTKHICNCIKCIEEGKITFLISLGYEVDNDFITYDENISKKEEWLKTFKEELKKRGVKKCVI